MGGGCPTLALHTYNPKMVQCVNDPVCGGPFLVVGIAGGEGTQNIWAYSDPTIAQIPVKGNVTDAGGVGDRFSNGVYFGDNSVVRYAYRNDALSPGTLYTLSCYVLMDDGEAPVVGTTTSSGDFTIIIEGNLVTNPASVVAVGDGIYRISGSLTSRDPVVTHNCGIIKYTGQSARGFKVSGFQIEAKGYATTLVPTNGAAATRSPEIIPIPTAGVVSFDEGTIELRFKPSQGFFQDGPGYQRIIGHASGVNLDEIELMRSGTTSRVSFAISNHTGQAQGGWNNLVSTTNLVVDTWYHIAVRWSFADETYAIFVNGVKESEKALSETYKPSVAGVTAIGYHPNIAGRHCNSAIADLRISNRARTDEEILAAYQSGEPLPVDEWTTYKMTGGPGPWESVGAVFPRPAWQALQARLTLTKTDTAAQSLDSVALWESVLMWMYDRPNLRVIPPQVTHVTVYVENSEPVVEYTASIAVEESKKVHIRIPVPEDPSLPIASCGGGEDISGV